MLLSKFFSIIYSKNIVKSEKYKPTDNYSDTINSEKKIVEKSNYRELAEEIGRILKKKSNNSIPELSVSYTHLRAHETPEHLVWRSMD